MSTVTAKFSSVGTKFQMGTAACAIATAAALTPAVIAQADISLPAPTAPITEILAAPFAGPVDFAEGWIWFGPTYEDAPAYSPVIAFAPLVLVPNFLKPLFGWFEQINFTACVFGLNFRVGPYGTFSVGISRGC